VQVNKKFSHGLQFVGAYTYSHNIDDATAEVFSTVLSPRRAQDGLNLGADRANSILDHRHRFTLSLIYDEPFFRNSHWLLKIRWAIGNRAHLYLSIRSVGDRPERHRLEPERRLRRRSADFSTPVVRREPAPAWYLCAAAR
jgi:hypothetical protein